MNRYVLTIFCDDIRHEVGGKFSYIGVYSGQMFVPSFPITLPKLCLAMNVVTSADTPFRKLAMRLLMDEAVLAEAALVLPNFPMLLRHSQNCRKTSAGSRASVDVCIFTTFGESPCTLRCASKPIGRVAYRVAYWSAQQTIPGTIDDYPRR